MQGRGRCPSTPPASRRALVPLTRARAPPPELSGAPRGPILKEGFTHQSWGSTGPGGPRRGTRLLAGASAGNENGKKGAPAQVAS